MPERSRLERTFFRLEAQHACLTWAFSEIAARPGPVLELGLGHGRTFDHMRRNLPGREIWVFDRANDAYEDCWPDPDHLILGEIAETFPAFASRVAGKVVLANSDIGYFASGPSRQNAQLAARLLPPVMAPGGIIMSDLDLDLPGFETLPLPAGARPGTYYLYRRPL
ncbi:MAG: hypothetical protein JNL61_16505 [Rhizobiaceae bacterium]|nr:hypothetical protein [Rhizobiaceae bacterium]